MDRPHTPGIGGYLLAWLVSVLVFAAGILALDNSPSTSPVGIDLGELLAVSAWVGGVSVLFAPWSMALVHYACRHLDAQVLHVFSAGVAGVVVGMLFSLLVPGFLMFVPQLALSTAVGRAVVVPLVWRRRAAWEPGQGRPTRPALSSYDDSCGGRRR